VAEELFEHATWSQTLAGRLVSSSTRSQPQVYATWSGVSGRASERRRALRALRVRLDELAEQVDELGAEAAAEGSETEDSLLQSESAEAVAVLDSGEEEEKEK